MKLKRLVAILFMILLLVGCGDKKKEDSSKESSNEPTKSLYCEEGTLKDGKCEIVVTAEATLTCEDGYKLEEGKCIKIETKAAKSNKTCSSGYTLSGNECVSNQNYDKVSTKKCITPDDLKDMGNGYESGSGDCMVSACIRYRDGECIDGVSAHFDYTIVSSCPSETKEISGKCKKTAAPTNNYTCEAGELNGKNCVTKTTVDAAATCEAEYSYNTESTMCEKITLVDAKEK